jgi:hypothetical protein
MHPIEQKKVPWYAMMLMMRMIRDDDDCDNDDDNDDVRNDDKNEDNKSDDYNNANMKNNIITIILVRARSQRIPISLKYEFAYDITCNDDDD